jgi:hypothetical protein
LFLHNFSGAALAIARRRAEFVRSLNALFLR